MDLTPVTAIMKKHLAPLQKDSPLSTKELDILCLRGMADLCLWLAEEREVMRDNATLDDALDTYPGSARENGSDFGKAIAQALLELYEEANPEETSAKRRRDAKNAHEDRRGVDEDDPDDLTDAERRRLREAAWDEKYFEKQ